MKSDFLYRFVRSMDEGETRYCRAQLQQDDRCVKRGYLALFDALASMAEYDAEAVVHCVADFPMASSLAVEKIRLYQTLLHNIKELHSKRRSANDPFQRLQEAQVLFDMGMNEEAVEVASKGLTQAVYMEDLWMEVGLRDLLRKVYKHMGKKQLTMTRTQNEYELVMAGKKLSKLLKYTQISDRMFDYVRNYRVTDSVAVQRGIEELMSAPEMKDSNQADSLPAQIKFFAIQQLYHLQKNDLATSNEMCKRQLGLWEQNPDRIKNDPLVYRSVLSNLIGKLTLLGKTDEALSYLNKLDAMKVLSRRDEALQFGYVELQFQLFYMNQGKLPEVLEREEKVLVGLKRYQKGMEESSVLVLLYNLGITHMICENTNAAIAYFERILHLGKLPVRLDLQGIARLLRLLLMFDKEDILDLKHFLRNSNAFFERKDRGHELETTVREWIAVHNATVGTMERRQSFGELATLLAPFVKSRILGAEEMYIWATARNRRMTLTQVLNEQLNASTTA